MKPLTYPVVPLCLQLLMVILFKQYDIIVVMVMAVSISFIWSFVVFISLFLNILLFIWVIFCDEFPFSTLLCCLTSTRLLVGSLARCHLKFLHPVFIPLKIGIMEVWGSLLCFGSSPSQHYFWWHGLSCWSQLDTLVSARVKKDLNIFNLLWQYKSIWLSSTA